MIVIYGVELLPDNASPSKNLNKIHKTEINLEKVFCVDNIVCITKSTTIVNGCLTKLSPFVCSCATFYLHKS